MEIPELRDALLDIVSSFFAETEVIWAEQQQTVKPSLPFVMIKLSGISSARSAIIPSDSSDLYCKPATAKLEVQLFTQGRIIQDEGYTENTASADMMDFIWYVDSQSVTDKCSELDISIERSGDIVETTQLVDNQFEYRAMQEFDVSFTTIRRGRACIAPETGKASFPNSSGGGTEQMASEITGTIEKVNFNEEDKQ